MNSLYRTGLLFAFVLLSDRGLAAVVDVVTALDGSDYNLVSIELSATPESGLPNRTYAYDELIPSTVVDYTSIAEGNLDNTVTVIGAPSGSLPSGSDRLRLLGDKRLNTGVFNPSGSMPSMTLRFDRPVFNRPGGDLVLFELTIGDGQTPDPVVLQQVGGDDEFHRVRPSHYQAKGDIPAEAAPNTHLAAGSEGYIADFLDLQHVSLIDFGTVTNPEWHAMHFDLSWIGVPENGWITELALRSGNETRAVDLLMVLGQPHVPPGDYNGDAQVDGADYIHWKSQFGQAVAPFTDADGNGDGLVNLADYTVWRDNFSTAPAVPSSTSSVPEPQAWWLPCLGTLVLVRNWRR